MATTPPARFPYSTAALAAALDAVARDQLHIEEGAEVELRTEDGRIVVEVVRPKILEPVSDVSARAERQKQIAEATEHAMSKHHDLLVLLAR
jgi:hypothetical protein